MINTKKFASVGFGFLICAAAVPAFAAVTFSRVGVDNSAGGAALTGYVTNDIKISFDGQYTGAQALIDLSGAGANAIYQDSAGNAAPPSALFVGVFPSLAFDSFAAQGSALSGGANGEPSLGGGAVDLGGAAGASFTSSLINQAWNPAGGVTITDQSDFLIGRFTLSATANGTAKFLASAGGTPVDITGNIVNGVISFGSVPVLPTVGDLSLVQSVLNETLTGDVALTNVNTLAFDGVAAPMFTPLIPGKPLTLGHLPTLDNAGHFSWDTSGSLRGTYKWAITGTGDGGTDTGLITVELNQVPEPATLSMIGLALVGCVGLARRRG